MKTVLWAGVVMIVLGIASSVVPIPQTERHGIQVEGVNLGITTNHNERVSPLISIVLIVGGIAFCLASVRKPSKT